MRFPRLPDRRGQQADAAVCDAAVRQSVQRVTTLSAQLSQCQSGAKQKGQCTKLTGMLAAARAQLDGERAKCMYTARIDRKSTVMQARAERAAFKTQIEQQRQQRQQQRLETAMQRQQYKMEKVRLREMRAEAGQSSRTETLMKVGAVAAVAAAALIF